MSQLSQPVMIQGDREIFCEDIDHIRTILERFSSLSRYEITLTLCETLEWLTPAGRPKIEKHPYHDERTQRPAARPGNIVGCDWAGHVDFP